MMNVRGGDHAERCAGLGDVDRLVVAELNHRNLLRAFPRSLEREEGQVLPLIGPCPGHIPRTADQKAAEPS